MAMSEFPSWDLAGSLVLLRGHDMRGFPQRWVVYDTETQSERVSGPTERFNLTFRLGVAYFHDPGSGSSLPGGWLYFEDPEVFHWHLGMMPLASDPIWIFAHNHAFDARIVGFLRKLGVGNYSLLPPDCVKGGSRFREPLFVGECPPFLMRLWRPDGQQLILSDTFQWTYHSLGWCGEKLHIPKGTLPPADASNADLMSYCRQDVKVLKATLERIWHFCRVIDIKDWQPTVASQAYHSWKCRYERRRIKRPEDIGLMALDRQGYYGGRTDCFRLGQTRQTVYAVDVNSLYPSVMRNSLFPTEIHDYDMETQASQEELSFGTAETTAEVYLDTQDRPYPVRHRGGVWYCQGRVRTVLCGPELAEAFRAGHVRRIGRWVTYRLGRLFGEWVDDLWQRRVAYRKVGNEFNAWICKLLLNSLCGKFGQRTGHWIHHDDEANRQAFGSGRVVGQTPGDDIQYRTIAGSTYYRYRHEEDPRGFVPIAAWITSYARCYMDLIRSLAGSDAVLYQATDSLLLTQTGFDRLKSYGLVAEDELGKVRLEGVHEWASIVGINHVILAGVPRIAGIKTGSREVEPNLWEIETWGSLGESISKGKVSSVSVRQTFKRCAGTYKAGKASSHGSVTPWSISNWHLSPREQARMPLPLDR